MPTAAERNGAQLAELDSSARVLVRETNWLGDIMISLPALRAVRRRFARGRLAVQVRANLAQIVRGLSWVDEVIPFRVRRGVAGIGDRRAAVREIRRRRFDLAILFPNSLDSALWPFLARIPRRLGYACDGRRVLLTDPVPVTRAILAQHQVHYYLNLLRPLGIEETAEDPALEVAAEAEAEAEALLAELPSGGPIVVFAPGAAYGPAREWPASHYAELARQLVEKHDARIVLDGAPNERAKCLKLAARISDLSNGALLVTAGRTSVAGLAALLKRCAAFVGNDSGATHVAGVVGIPTVGIFGSTSPDRTGPLGPRTAIIRKPISCSPCGQRTCRFGHYRCLTEVFPADVLARLEALAPFAGTPV